MTTADPPSPSAPPAAAPATFDQVGLRPELVEATRNLGFTEMTPVQRQALPPVLAGRDVVAQAKTGSGKTAAFGLGLLQRLDTGRPPGAPVALVLSPTRELALQVAAELRRLAQRLPNTRVLAVCGGKALRHQRNALDQGVHVVVGTPGRVADHLRRGSLDLSALAALVLDEADRMLDMGFIDQVQDIVRQCPTTAQRLLFSATFPPRIDALSAAVQATPVSVKVEAAVSAEDLHEELVRCPREDRADTVARLLSWHRPAAALIFAETRQNCEDLQHHLARCGAPVLALHGGLDQRERDDVLVQFANGSARFLVATDVAARGLDIPALPMVVQAELPRDPEVHVHRIGRTARAGEQGRAVAVVAAPWEEERLVRIEAARGRPIPAVPLPPAGPPRFAPSPVRTLLILAGRKQKLRKGDVVGALVKDAGIPPEAIGDIHLAQTTCAVALDRAHARTALHHLRRGRIKKARVRATLLGD